MLRSLDEELNKRGLELMLSGLTGPVRAFLDRAGVLEKLGRERVHRLTMDGALDFLARSDTAPDANLALVHDALDRLREVVEQVEPRLRGEKKAQLDQLHRDLEEDARRLEPWLPN
jgi:hypothetical protein